MYRFTNNYNPSWKEVTHFSENPCAFLLDEYPHVPPEENNINILVITFCSSLIVSQPMYSFPGDMSVLEFYIGEIILE